MSGNKEIIIHDTSSNSSDEEDVIVQSTPRIHAKRKRASLVIDEDDEESRQTSQASRHSDDENDDTMEVFTPKNKHHIGSKHAVNNRLTIKDSDDEEIRSNNEDANEDSINEQSNITPVQTRSASRLQLRDHTSNSAESQSFPAITSRRSTRIEKKRQVKTQQHFEARKKLKFRGLDTWLGYEKPGEEYVSSEEDDDEDDKDDYDFEHNAAKSQHKNKRKQVNRSYDSEKVYADGGADLDEFIVEDDEIEYMEEDEEPVLLNKNACNRHNPFVPDNNNSDFDAMIELELMRSREPKQWLMLYLEYLQDAIEKEYSPTASNHQNQSIDNHHKSRLYEKAVNHVEKALESRKESLRSNVVWPDELLDACHTSTKINYANITAERECMACNKRNHFATYSLTFSGVAVDATELYECTDWMQKLQDNLKQDERVHSVWHLGSTCFARIFAYWQLLHAKHFWVALVDVNLVRDQQNTEEIREKFLKKEAQRFLQLLSLVDNFSFEKHAPFVRINNVWNGVQQKVVDSRFLKPPFSLRRRNDDEDCSPKVSRVADISNQWFVGDSESDNNEEDEEQALENKLKPAPHTPLLPNPRITNTITPITKVSYTERKEITANICLMCKSKSINCGLLHGNSMHLYCCYRCGSKEEECQVCHRPIDRVIKILPLPDDAMQSIQSST